MNPTRQTRLWALSALAAVALLALGFLAVRQLPAKPDSGEKASETPPEGHSAAQGHARTTPNRLGEESSPYLLLHQFNPVDWYPWGEEALRKAKEEDKPIFLSVGYSTCYWCHVMERESFSDPAIAAILNRDYVPIKVDREERPDLDEIYMTATQLFTRRGGWPNSVFLTPDLEPFYAGTYFPPDDGQGRPGFSTLLNALTEAWKTKRDDIETQAKRLAEAMGLLLEKGSQPAEQVPPASVAQTAIDSLLSRFDATWGGFGGAPKFPSPANLFLLADALDDQPKAAEALRLTLDRMARGGMYDQAGGGFHRYSVDAYWRVPHFEKMLYDNGALMEVYALWYAHAKDPEAARILRETALFLERELTSPEGAFWSAIDAETDAHEGAFYVWTREELEAVLGKEGASFLAPIYDFDGEPNFEGSHYVLWLPESLETQARAIELSRGRLLARIRPLLDQLLAARAERKRPLTDDKILTSWNGLAIAGLATAGRVLDEADFVRRAAKAAHFLLRELRPEGKALQHSWRGGKAKIDAYLEDYAYLIHGLLCLHRATGEGEWLRAAEALSKEQSERLAAPGGGFYVAAEDPDLLFQSREYTDNARQAPNGVAVLNLLHLAEASGDRSYRRQAEKALKAFSKGLLESPQAARSLALATHRYHRGQEGDASATAEARQELTDPLEKLARDAVEVVTKIDRSASEGWLPLEVTVTIRQGWHINANPASDEFLIPTSLEAEEGHLRGVTYPPAELRSFSYATGDLAVYEGQARITGDVTPAGAQSLTLTYQACDDRRCLQPVTLSLGEAAP